MSFVVKLTFAYVNRLTKLNVSKKRYSVRSRCVYSGCRSGFPTRMRSGSRLSTKGCRSVMRGSRVEVV